MKLYSAVVRDKRTGKIELLERKEYETKAKFIEDIRLNGYTVNTSKVKESVEFDRILNHTNAQPWDWQPRKYKNM